MALDPVTELEALVDAFDADGVDYALCGGLALAVHGHPRATQDIDILIEPAQLASAIATAKRIGFDVPARKMTFGRKTRTPREVHRVSKLDPESGELLVLDLLIVNAELAGVWSGRQSYRSGARDRRGVSRRACYDEEDRRTPAGSRRCRQARRNR